MYAKYCIVKQKLLVLVILQKQDHRQRRYLELSSLSVDLMSKVGMWVRWDSDVPTKHVKSLVEKQAFKKKRNDLTRKGFFLKVYKI
jgi:hypothetical protein